jgi:hypothetical protein
MGKQKETSREELERFPQFTPDYAFSTHFDLDTGKHYAFPKERENQIRAILSKCIEPHLQAVPFREKPTGLDRFLHNAVRALAIYIHQHKSLPSFDRERARKAINNALNALRPAQQELQAIAAWPELVAYLQRIYLGADKHDQFPGANKRQYLAAERLHKAEFEAFQKISPTTVVGQLSPLESLLMVAEERVKFRPGDPQRKDHVQEFVDCIGLAWICGTGRLPTYSKVSGRSRGPSPFAALMIAINTQILPKHMQSQNYFRDYAQKSVKRLKQEFPELQSR